MNRANTPAYPYPPIQDAGNNEIWWGSEGMTIREAYIMAAMQGLCANSVATQEFSAAETGIRARQIADATLKAAGIEE